MQTSFTDLVGTVVVPAHCIDSNELTDLSPTLGAAVPVGGMALDASEAGPSFIGCTFGP